MQTTALCLHCCHSWTRSRRRLRRTGSLCIHPSSLILRRVLCLKELSSPQFMSSVFVVTLILYLSLLSSFISSAAASGTSFIGSKRMLSLPSTASSTPSSSSLSTRLVHYSIRLKREEGRDTDSLLSAPSSSRLSHASPSLTKKVNHRHHLNASSFPRLPPSSSYLLSSLLSSSSEGYSRSEVLGPPAVSALLQRNMSDFSESSVLPRIDVLEVEKRFYWCIRYRVTGKTPRIREWFFNDQPLNLTETIKDLQSPAVVKNGSFDEG